MPPIRRDRARPPQPRRQRALTKGGAAPPPQSTKKKRVAPRFPVQKTSAPIPLKNNHKKPPVTAFCDGEQEPDVRDAYKPRKHATPQEGMKFIDSIFEPPTSDSRKAPDSVDVTGQWEQRHTPPTKFALKNVGQSFPITKAKNPVIEGTAWADAANAKLKEAGLDLVMPGYPHVMIGLAPINSGKSTYINKWMSATMAIGITKKLYLYTPTGTLDPVTMTLQANRPPGCEVIIKHELDMEDLREFVRTIQEQYASYAELAERGRFRLDTEQDDHFERPDNLEHLFTDDHGVQHRRNPRLPNFNDHAPVLDPANSVQVERPKNIGKHTVRWLFDKRGLRPILQYPGRWAMREDLIPGKKHLEARPVPLDGTDPRQRLLQLKLDPLTVAQDIANQREHLEHLKHTEEDFFKRHVNEICCDDCFAMPALQSREFQQYMTIIRHFGGSGSFWVQKLLGAFPTVLRYIATHLWVGGHLSAEEVENVHEIWGGRIPWLRTAIVALNVMKDTDQVEKHSYLLVFLAERRIVMNGEFEMVPEMCQSIADKESKLADHRQ